MAERKTYSEDEVRAIVRQLKLDITHKFRNRLTVPIGFIQLALRPTTSPDKSKYFLEKSSQHLQATTIEVQELKDKSEDLDLLLQISEEESKANKEVQSMQRQSPHSLEPL